MNRWRKTAMGAVVVLALTGVGSSAAADSYRKTTLYWSPATGAHAATADDGSYLASSAIGSKWAALGGR